MKELEGFNSLKVQAQCKNLIKPTENSQSFCYGVGRLGNQISTLASQFGFWKDFGIKINLIQFQIDEMTDVFDFNYFEQDLVKIWTNGMSCYPFFVLYWKIE